MDFDIKKITDVKQLNVLKRNLIALHELVDNFDVHEQSKSFTKIKKRWEKVEGLFSNTANKSLQQLEYAYISKKEDQIQKIINYQIKIFDKNIKLIEKQLEKLQPKKRKASQKNLQPGTYRLYGGYDEADSDFDDAASLSLD